MNTCLKHSQVYVMYCVYCGVPQSPPPTSSTIPIKTTVNSIGLDMYKTYERDLHDKLMSEINAEQIAAQRKGKKK